MTSGDAQYFSPVEDAMLEWIPTIGPRAFTVWALINGNYNRKHGYLVSHLGINRLAQKTGMSVPTVRKQIEELDKRGLICRVDPRVATSGRPPKYYKPVLPIPTAPAATEDSE